MIDWRDCAVNGAIGAVGAIPGTALAHPFDVVKIRQQISGNKFQAACVSIAREGKGPIPYRNFVRGVSPAIQQKILTRAPMFFASSLSTKWCEAKLGLAPMHAAFVGSAASGYATGGFASLFEWRKVLVSQVIGGGVTPTVRSLLSDAVKIHGPLSGLRNVARRVHAAGYRNAVFDSVFFGSKHYFMDHLSLGPGLSYGCAAASAVVADFAVDVVTKRRLALPAAAPIPGGGMTRAVVVLVSLEGGAVFTGISTKCTEFSISYITTGTLAPHVENAFNSALASAASLR